MHRPDQRRRALLLTLAAVAAGGALLGTLRLHAPEADTVPATHDAPHADRVRRLFDAAVVMLHARRHEEAVTALHEVLRYAPTMPEAHVNMGFALLGLQRLKEAQGFFDSAMALAPAQANAYYGLALVHEAGGDLELASGAMRSFLHLARGERPEHLAKARAALWEWEQQRAAAGGAPMPAASVPR